MMPETASAGDDRVARVRSGVPSSRGKMRVMPISTTVPAPGLPMLARGRAVRANARRPVAAWLFVCCALVFAMVVVGGVTRLTHSGLSIVEWQPIVGTLPPLVRRRVAADVREVPG